ncbi:MarR family winged helix-turn-helix transcriptional regulator [Roseospira goensis]|uniref:DNA-binding MarR family transcriptional regulator n=1 Tax=Roseospira goensis TaxID=391922 RepID=A0A7W6RYP3_9PROT|nr:MarR family winged helix-turn-helix transcriptional regulator [Roseospira goensis]MBB4285693.1 DNA-binding MarR family transcriptional regulator [Roseospira goensis]
MLEIFRLRRKLLDKGDDLVRPLRMTSADWQLLGAVALAGQPMTTPMIAEAMGLTRQGAQKRLNRMVEQGYFRQQANPRHERSPLYVLTEYGSAAFNKAMALHARWASALVQDLDPDHLEHALEVLQALGRRLEDVRVPRAGVPGTGEDGAAGGGPGGVSAPQGPS